MTISKSFLKGEVRGLWPLYQDDSFVFGAFLETAMCLSEINTPDGSESGMCSVFIASMLI